MCFFSPNTDALTPLRSYATPDRAPDHLADGTPAVLRDDLISILGPTAVRSRVTDLVKYATDASPYRLFPQVVIVAESVEQIAKTLQYAKQNHRSVTFRASGSSLNGQSQGDDILIDVRNCFNGLEILQEGIYARIKPGTVISTANRALLPYNRVLGPDPASSGVATIGGVVANNASGMTAGTKLNSYHTVASMKILLPSGTLIDTGDREVDGELFAHEREIHEGLLEIREEILRDEAFAAWIKKKFSIKNTNGYRLDAFLDCSTPGAILQKLMVGSEGTLGYIAEVTLLRSLSSRFAQRVSSSFPVCMMRRPQRPTLSRWELWRQNSWMADACTLQLRSPEYRRVGMPSAKMLDRCWLNFALRKLMN